jgi:hypothetical protein
LPNKLKAVIKEYGRWSELDTYIDRIETHIEIDFSHSLENAKALQITNQKDRNQLYRINQKLPCK